MLHSLTETVVRALLALCLTTGLVLSTVVSADDAGPKVPRGKGEMCVAPLDDMRRNHMDYIMHQRDETVIGGIRGKKFSLVDCVDCHAQHDDAGRAIRIDAKDQFCQSCHGFAAVQIDCFSCHRATPDLKPESAGRSHSMLRRHGQPMMRPFGQVGQ